jgi:cytochrome bd-type quinol oxidase subunit 1
MKRRVRFALLAGLVFTLCWGIFFISQAHAQAKKVTPMQGVKFNTAESLADNLRTYAGKDLIVHLRSGKTIQGYVKSVGNGLLHLEKLAGRDFYDALIRMEDISAIEAKFRDMK